MRALVVFCLAAQGLLLAQAPRVGLIEFYGVRRASERQLRHALGVKTGDPLPRSKGAIEERLRKIDGVVSARVEAVCCRGDRAVLYVGIEERGEPHIEFRPEPVGDVSLPASTVASYSAFLTVLEKASRSAPVTENLIEGHELSSDPGARTLQEGFVAIAKENLETLRTVLRDAGDPFQRACAAYILGYFPSKQKVVEDLQSALRDPDEGVRANAIRALAAIAALGERNAELGIRVQATWFIELLNSVVRSDRVNSASALVALTEKRPSYALEQIRERALYSLAGMAHWQTLEDALPAFIVLGRAAGLSDDAIHQAWTGDREAFIRRALKK